MTHGSLWNKLLIFALPLAASSILQQLFNSVDTAVVGRFASSRALAAVGSNSSLIALMINLFIGISLGSNVIISRYIGQKAEEHVKGAIHTAIVVALCSGIFVLVLGQFIARPVLTLMGTPKDVLDLAVLYLRIYFLGMPFIMLYDFSSSILRSIGDSRRPLYALIAAGIINTGLNLILVIVFHLGVSGVAIATVVSNIVSSGILFYILLHEQEPIRVSLSGLSIDWGELKKILIIGVPAGLQGMVFSLANVCIQSMINSFGSNAIAGSAAALNFEFFAYFMVNAFAQTTVTFTSQNYGAGDFQRCKKVYRLCMIFSVIFCGLLSGIFVLGRDFFLRLYTTDPNVLTFAVQRLLIVTTLELLTSTYEISGFLDDEIRACGKSDFSKTVSWWWLRSPGRNSFSAAEVDCCGWILRCGVDVCYDSDGVRPALHLNLSSSNLFSYAGTVSSDGTKKEVPYNTRTRLVQT